MLLCHCRVVSDREIRTAIDCGACDLQDVGRECGAGTGCGGCLPAIRRMLAAAGDGEHDTTPRTGARPPARMAAGR